MAVITVAGDGAVKLTLFFGAFRQIAFRAFVKHTDQRADDFKVAQLFGSDIHQHIFTARIVIAQPLGKVTAGCRQFALRAAELLKQ